MPSKLIVKSHEPKRLQIAVAALALLVVAGAWGLFEWGRKAAGYNRIEAARVRGELNDRISVLNKENETFRRDLAVLRTSDRIDQEAYSQVSVDLDDLQSQIAGHRKSSTQSICRRNGGLLPRRTFVDGRVGAGFGRCLQGLRGQIGLVS